MLRLWVIRMRLHIDKIPKINSISYKSNSVNFILKSAGQLYTENLKTAAKKIVSNIWFKGLIDV